MAGKDLELALRIKADLTQGQKALEELGHAVEGVGEAAQASSNQLGMVGETADQQAARIRAMVEASLQQQAASDALADSVERGNTVAQQANTTWQQTAAAQSEAMNAYHNAERAAEQKAQADLQAAEAAKQAALAVDKEAQELQQLLGKIDPVIRKLDELDEMEQQLRRSRDAGNIDVETYDTFNAKLQEQRQRLGGTTDAMRTAGITAGQYQQAMRQLPMQITDITTSLASGMPIWLVAVQQGGQIKDSFGGIGNAARALVSTINPLTLAIAAATAAVGATALGFYQGSQESTTYREQLILTGNAAGTSSDQLMAMAASMDAVRGTQRQAAAALAEIAGTGKIASDQIMLVASAAIAMQQATGRAVSETVAEFVKLADDPVKAVAELNREYNFLSAAVYEQIAALVEHGDEAEAARLAMDELAQTMEARATEIEDNLGLLEQAWKNIKGAAAEAWDAMAGVGREQTLEEQLEALDQRGISDLDFASLGANAAVLGPLGAAKELWDQLSPTIRAATEEGATQLEQERARLLLAIKQRDAKAAEQAETARLNRESIEAQQAIAKVREQGLTRAEQKEKAIAEYRANVEKIRSADPGSALISTEKIDKDIAAIERRYSERQKRTPVDRDQRARENYLAQLERQAATLDMTTTEVRQYELAEKGLTGALQARAQAAMALIDASEQQRQADANARTNAGLEAEFLRSAGRETDAALLEIRTRFADMRTEFEQAGNEAGQAWLDQLIPVAEAKVRVDDVQRQMDRVLAERQRQEQSVNVQQDAGLITELQARKQLLDIHRQTHQQLEDMRPVLEELAQQPGAVGEAASAALASLDDQAQRLLATTSLLAEALRDGLTSGLTEAITGLAKGTMDIRDAINAVAESVANALLRIAAESMAQSAVTSFSRMFTDVVPAAAQAVSAIGTVTAAKVAADTTMTASGVTAATTTAAAQTTAATATTTAWTPAAVAASIGSFGSAAAIGLAAVMAALAFQAFATGGHVRGPGTRTSDSIPALLSNDEFVTRAAVVTQPGALPFLEDFNERGMPALDDWSARARHANGGLAGVPAPALPSPELGTAQLAEPARPGSTLNNSVNLYAVQNPDDVAAMAWGKAGQEHYMVYLQQNASTVRQVLGV